MPDTPPPGTPAADPNKDTPTNTPAPQDPNATPPTNPTPTPTGISQDDHVAAIEAARTQEREKLYATREKEKVEREELTTTIADRDKEVGTLKEKLQSMEDASLSDTEKVQRQIEKLETSNVALKSQLEEVADAAAARIVKSEQRAYRDRALRESEITLTELVPEDGTKDEIDAAIAKAEKREEKIFARAEEKVRKENAANVPTPVAPNVGTETPGLLKMKDRRDIAKLRGAEWQTARQKMLQEARDSTGRGRA